MASKLSTWWQKSRLRSWWMKIQSGLHWLWQRIKQHPFITVGIVVALLAIIAFTLAVYLFGWNWTGLTGGESKITKTPQETTIEYSPGKNLWDWMQLLLIPILLAIGGYWFNQIQKSRDEKTAEAQKQREENDTKEREKLERESREDNQRETALQAYLDKMSELLLEKHLRDSAEDDEVRKIARARTLTMLRGLDPVRKASVIQFLHESSLIDKDTCIISLRGANLSAANLSHADLSTADLSFADLSGANLYRANLSTATLVSANLSTADLSGANLSGANLSNANLYRAKLNANLSNANLSNANLQLAKLNANLSNANLYDAQLIATDLSGAFLSQQQLDQVATCIGATLPKGLTCHHNIEMV